MCVSVSTDIENKAAWKPCLSVQGVRLPTAYYFGMTAATGDLSDNHDIMSVRLYELDLPDDVSTVVPDAYTVHIEKRHLIFSCLTFDVM
jgi:Legume-like lectin family.